MEIAAPHWLLLLPLIGLISFLLHLSLSRPLRAALILLLVLALIDIRIRKNDSALDLWVLIDRSESADQSVGNSIREWQSILERSKPARDRIRYIEYADEALESDDGRSEASLKVRNASRSALAIRTALSRRDPLRSARVLLLTDGYSTESLEGIAELLRDQGISLDYRLGTLLYENDSRISRFSVPAQVVPGENFLLETIIEGSPGAQITLDIERDGRKIGSVRTTLQKQKEIVRFSDQLTSDAGVPKYTVRLHDEKDKIEGNNVAQRWVQVTAPKKILVITSYDNDPLVQVLQERNVPVRVVRDGNRLSVADLTNAGAVVLNNVPASAIAESFLKGIEFYVSSQGGGLLMTGGEQSFGLGGYYQSAIDEMLPISMEMREDLWRQSASIALVLDRSGSMAATVNGNLGTMSKMDLANEGAARTISLLSESDYVALFAVDTVAHKVVPPTKVEQRRDELMAKARSIHSAGGGIYVYTGLKAAWEALQKSGPQTKHVILFADAADAEEPGEYETLLTEISDAKASVSVIALGRQSDSDAEFLIDVAKRGRGRIFFVENAVDVPSVFAQETVAVVRSSFAKKAQNIIVGNGWSLVSSNTPNWLSRVDGYNINYARPKASTILAAADDGKSPLLSVWRKGIGRAAALALPIGGEYAKRFRSWSEYGESLHTLLEWLRVGELPSGLNLRSEVVGNELFLDLYYDESWERLLSMHPPSISLLQQSEAEVEAVAWEKMRPGHFRTRFFITHSEALRGVVVIKEHTIPFGPISLGQDPEWVFDSQRIAELRGVSSATGGGRLVDLSEVWEMPRAITRVRLAPYLLMLCLVLFLIDALLTRLGRTRLVARAEGDQASTPRSGFAIGRLLRKESRDHQGEPQPYRTQSATEVLEAQESDKDDTEASRKRRSRFDKAKRRGV